MIPGLSDLDVMVILNTDSLKKNEIKLLNAINLKVYKKYPIHMTFRLRNPTEISEETSTTNDFGPTSIWNYYKDSWYIYGEDMTIEFIKKMQRSTLLVKNDIRERILELRKNFRSLYSIHTLQSSTTTTKSKEKGLSYKIGDLLGELAQLVCWVHGERFSSAYEATVKAKQLSKVKLFEYAQDIKQSKKPINIFSTYEIIENTFYNLLKQNFNKSEILLKNQQFTTRDTVGLVLRNTKNEKYLLLKRAAMIDYWTVPKGGVKQGEPFDEALKRELFEETQISKFTINGNLLPLNHTYLNKEKQYVKTKTHYFNAETTESKVILSNEHIQFKWVTKNQFLKLSKHRINLLISEYMV